MQIKACVGIAVFNNPNTIAGVVEDILLNTNLPVLLIDDGSTLAVEELLTDEKFILARESKRLYLLRHSENLGKGMALQTGFQKATRLGFTHFISFDGDGQHLVKDIPLLLTQVEENPWSLVIGARRFLSESVPKISKFGRRFSNFWVGFETGKTVQDSQSGFRAYPLFHLQTLSFFTKRYDFEIEVLIRLLWKGVEVKEVPISVVYQGKERVSHFKKVKDNFRISILNTVLVALSLLKRHTEPIPAAIAVGFGVWVGTTPFYGFHTPIAVLLSLVLKLNAPLVFLGTQISIPPMAPFLGWASIELGSKILNLPLSKAVFKEWLLGSLVLGFVLGAVSGFLVYSVLIYKKKIQTEKAWTGRMRGGRLGNGILKWVAKYLGLKAAYFTLYFITPYFYIFAPKATKASLEYWKVLNPEMGFWGRRYQVLKHYFQFGCVLLDRMYQELQEKPIFKMNPTGLENILTKETQGEGLILLSAHMGSWDIAAHYMFRAGLKSPFHTVQFKPESINEMEKLQPNEQTIYANEKKHAVLDIQTILSKKNPVGMMGDRPTSRRYELVSFFDKLIPIDTTPFRMSATLQVPLLFTFGFRGKAGVYDFYASPSRKYIFVTELNKEVQCKIWAQEFADTLESFTKKYSNQWFNFFPIFSTEPVLVG